MKTGGRHGAVQDAGETGMNKTIILAGVLLLIGAAAFACDMSFFLIGPDGREKRITPDTEISLKTGSDYQLLINFTEDHGRCDVSPEDTVFLLNDEKWNPSKDDAALQMKSDVKWTMVSSREHETRIPFHVSESGEIQLEVIRDCSRKAGYDEIFTFTAA